MIGQQIGSYRVLDKLGEGGMGEVYRARDTKLDRDVAIKVLPDIFATDPDRLMRFQREAKTLASLNHPTVATIYGIEDRALIMELVEGEDLSQVIARGALPLEDAMPILRQIADALATAHDAGIVHRDLKPANIKLRADGTVKVLDFGLAKALDPTAASDADIVQSPTFTSPALTQMGVVLGTAACMAPEQAKGRAVDRRADVWAFGAVFFELLSGHRAFKGEDVSDLLAAVLKSDPDWSSLPHDLPAPVRRLLQRCLEKDSRRRWQAMGDVRYEMDAIAGELDAPTPSAPAAPRSPLWRRTWPVLIGTLAGAALVGIVASGRPAMKAPVTRLLMEYPETASKPALSPDGSRVAYVASERLRVRDLSAFDRLPIWSPDGSRIAFQSTPPGQPAGLFVRRADGAGDAERLTTAQPGTEHIPESWSRDGR